MSDYDSEHLLATLRSNVSRCLPSEPAQGSLGTDGSIRDRAHVVGHIWGTDTSPLSVHAPPDADGRFDYILLADTVWASSTIGSDVPHAPLVSTLVRVLSRSNKSARVLVVCGFHTGRAAIQAFFERAESEGLVPDDWGKQEWTWSPLRRGEAAAGQIKTREWRDDEPVLGDDKGKWVALARLKWSC
jgi:nicotinamide N-methyltransferase